MDRSSLENLFSKTLKIPNSGWENLVEEIKAFKELDDDDFDRINELYRCLSEQIQAEGFAADELRFVYSKDRPRSDCREPDSPLTNKKQAQDNLQDRGADLRP